MTEDKIQELNAETGVVIAEKCFHKGALMGHISRGGGLVAISNGKYLKFIALNPMFVTIQLIEVGMGKEIATQTWAKVKIEKAKPKIAKKIVGRLDVNEEVKSSNMFEVD